MPSLISGILIILASCITEPLNPPIDEVTPYANLEKKIRSQFDSMANFTWDQYTELMTILSDKKFIVLPLNEMRNTYDKSSVVVGLRHDIDINPFKALQMAKIEKEFGFRATYFVLATADYYGTIINSRAVRNAEMGYLYQELSKTGAEIGIHNDLITLMLQYNCDPMAFNLDELNYYESLGIPVYGTASHGSSLAKQVGYINYEIFSDFAHRDSISYNGRSYSIGKYSLKEFGFEYEAYFIDFNKYFSEAGGTWRAYNDTNIYTYADILNKIKSSVPGDRIEILTHPERWGKTTGKK